MLIQGSLWPVAIAPVVDEELVYAIITHGPQYGGDEVGYVNIGFPRPDMRAWAEPPVSILEIQERQVRLYQKPLDQQPLDEQAKAEERQRSPSLKGQVRKKRDMGNEGA
jgi:hypothetical protein